MYNMNRKLLTLVKLQDLQCNFRLDPQLMQVQPLEAVYFDTDGDKLVNIYK